MQPHTLGTANLLSWSRCGQVDEALTRLDKEKPTMVKAIELQYFVGLTLGQISEILGVSERTVSSYLAYARAWLYRDIAERDAKP